MSIASDLNRSLKVTVTHKKKPAGIVHFLQHLMARHQWLHLDNAKKKKKKKKKEYNLQLGDQEYICQRCPYVSHRYIEYVSRDICAERRFQSACASAQSDQVSLSSKRSFNYLAFQYAPLKILIRLLEYMSVGMFYDVMAPILLHSAAHLL